MQFFSASAVSYECDRAWAYRYLEKRKLADAPWAAFADGSHVCGHSPLARQGRKSCSLCSKQRSFALGKATHAAGEAWYKDNAPDWSSLPGEVFMSGVAHLPHPSLCVSVEVETPIGAGSSGRTERFRWGEERVFVFEGVAWKGYKDLVVEPCAEESARLGLPAGQSVLVDYKTTASVVPVRLRDGTWVSYVKTPDELRASVQCSLYTLDECDITGADAVASRWLYLESKDVRRSVSVDVVHTRDAARDVMRLANERARHLAAIRTVADAEPNTFACAAYGGCMYHASVGGPCSARRSLGSLIRAQRRDTHMAIDPAVMARAQAATANASAAAPAANAGAPEGASAPAARPRGRPRANATPANATPANPAAVVAPTQSATEAIKALIAKREAAYEQAAAADAELTALRDQLTAALGESA